MAEERTAIALEEAGLTVTDLVLEDGAPDGSFNLSASTDRGRLMLSMDTSSGRFRSIEMDEGAALSEDQVAVLARASGNPIDDRARTRRAIGAAVAVVAAAAIGLGLARRARLAEQRAAE